MAEITPAFGDFFINVSHSVGRDKPNDWDDVLVVQALLAIIYNESPRFKKERPTKGPVVVSSSLEPDTPTLIAHFQRTQLKRVKPQGFINKARNEKNMRQSTIFVLNGLAGLIAAGLGKFGGADLIDGLRALHPSLSGSLVKVQPEDREPRLLDSTR